MRDDLVAQEYNDWARSNNFPFWKSLPDNEKAYWINLYLEREQKKLENERQIFQFKRIPKTFWNLHSTHYVNLPSDKYILIAGAPHTGKTTLLCDIVKHTNSIYIDAKEFQQDCERGNFIFENTTWEYLGKSYAHLVFDDVGSEIVRFNVNYVSSILLYRVNHGLPFVFTTSMTPERMKNYSEKLSTLRVEKIIKTFLI